VPAAFSSPKKTSTRAQGRPTKLTPQVKAKLKEAFSYGLNDDQAAAVAGVSDVTLTLWKRRPEFMAEIREAINERLLVRLKRIEAGENGWQGCGWILERLLPRQWAKPEVLIAVQNNLNVGVGAQNFEALVLEDAQFSKLSQNPNYAHRKPAVEVEASIARVPDEVAGTLVRTDCPRNAIVSESQEAENERRLREVDAKMAQLFAAKGKAKNGNGSGSAAMPEPSAGASNALVSAMIVMPAAEPGPGWWSQLVRGDNTREVERGTAIKIVRTILSDVFGQLRSQNTPVAFAPGTPILLRDVHAGLESLCGPHGWKALVKRGEA
jgi:hypothetical protein